MSVLRTLLRLVVDHVAEPVVEVVITCSECQTDSETFLDPAEAGHLAGVHNELHHGGALAAFVVEVDTSTDITDQLDQLDQLDPFQTHYPRVGNGVRSGQIERQVDRRSSRWSSRWSGRQVGS